MREVSLPLSAMALAVDVCWAIEPGYGRRAKAILDGIDYGAHLVEYSRGVGRAGPRADPEDGDDTADGDDSSRREYGDFSPDREEKEKRYSLRGRVATIHICGPMTKRPQSWGDGCATILVRRAIRQAVADPEVGAMLLLVDSPGGQVAGTADLAADVLEASKRKPLMCFAEDLCCSAAYWVGSQAGGGFYCNSTATMGSVGTIMALVDTSKAAKTAGIEVHVIATGDRKGIGADGVAITDEHLVYLRSYLDQLNVQFKGAVLAARKLTPARAAEVFRAGLYVGSEACKMGLCDGVKTKDQVYAMLAEKAGSAAASLAETVVEQRLRVSSSAGDRDVQALSPLLVPATGTMLPTSSTALTLPAPGPASIMPGSAGLENPERIWIPMKQQLVRALTLLGLQRMAVAVVGATDDTAETMAQAMSAEVNAEVNERIAKHDLILQCGAVGVTTAADFARFNAEAILGREYLQDLRTRAKAAAVRAFSAVEGPTIGAQVDHMPAAQIKTLLAAWEMQGDQMYGYGADGSAPARVSAPKILNESVNATSGAETSGAAATAWSRLKSDHQKYALQLLGQNATAEQKEAFAVQALMDLGQE